jgi:hypothetical protein
LPGGVTINGPGLSFEDENILGYIVVMVTPVNTLKTTEIHIIK